MNLNQNKEAKVAGLSENRCTQIERKTDLESSNSNNLFAKHPEIDLKSKIKTLNMGDNGNLVGKENVWETR